MCARTKSFEQAEILDKAIEIFRKNGYNATSMQDLVDNLGLNRSSIYDTFGNKKNLYFQALNLYKKNQNEYLMDLISNSESLIEAVQHLFQIIIDDTCSDNSKQGCFILNSCMEMANADDDIAKVIDNNFIELHKTMSKRIEKAIANNEIKIDTDANALSLFIFNTTNGLRVMQKAGMTAEAMQEVVRVAMSIFKK